MPETTIDPAKLRSVFAEELYPKFKGLSFSGGVATDPAYRQFALQGSPNLRYDPTTKGLVNVFQPTHSMQVRRGVMGWGGDRTTGEYQAPGGGLDPTAWLANPAYSGMFPVTSPEQFSNLMMSYLPGQPEYSDVQKLFTDPSFGKRFVDENQMFKKISESGNPIMDVISRGLGLTSLVAPGAISALTGQLSGALGGGVVGGLGAQAGMHTAMTGRAPSLGNIAQQYALGELTGQYKQPAAQPAGADISGTQLGTQGAGGADMANRTFLSGLPQYGGGGGGGLDLQSMFAGGGGGGGGGGFNWQDIVAGGLVGGAGGAATAGGMQLLNQLNLGQYGDLGPLLQAGAGGWLQQELMGQDASQQDFMSSMAGSQAGQQGMQQLGVSPQMAQMFGQQMQYQTDRDRRQQEMQQALMPMIQQLAGQQGPAPAAQQPTYQAGQGTMLAGVPPGLLPYGTPQAGGISPAEDIYRGLLAPQQRMAQESLREGLRQTTGAFQRRFKGGGSSMEMAQQRKVAEEYARSISEAQQSAGLQTALGLGGQRLEQQGLSLSGGLAASDIAARERMQQAGFGFQAGESAAERANRQSLMNQQMRGQMMGSLGSLAGTLLAGKYMPQQQYPDINVNVPDYGQYMQGGDGQTQTQTPMIPEIGAGFGQPPTGYQGIPGVQTGNIGGFDPYGQLGQGGGGIQGMQQQAGLPSPLAWGQTPQNRAYLENRPPQRMGGNQTVRPTQRRF